MKVEWLTVRESEDRLGGQPVRNVSPWHSAYIDLWVDGKPRGWVRRGDALCQGEGYTAWVWRKGCRGEGTFSHIWKAQFDDLDGAKNWARYKWSEVKELYGD